MVFVKLLALETLVKASRGLLLEDALWVADTFRLLIATGIFEEHGTSETLIDSWNYVGRWESTGGS